MVPAEPPLGGDGDAVEAGMSGEVAAEAMEPELPGPVGVTPTLKRHRSDQASVRQRILDLDRMVADPVAGPDAAVTDRRPCHTEARQQRRRYPDAFGRSPLGGAA